MEFINETERIACIRLHELTAGQARIFFEQFEESHLSDLTVFYDGQSDILFLNHDCRMYDEVRQITLDYMALSEDEKVERKNHGETPDMCREIFGVIDGMVQKRQEKQLVSILQKQRGQFLPMAARQAIWSWCDCNEDVAMHCAYQYGIIQGKRVERAKRKRGRL